eukprot:GHVQ01033033.1.p1 GENE.GHVQ01033033.1~~GHVQ01033033.1.p1  ORF type:complete len:184 (+),score=20.54 GHVQ01033033.1:249-800(+)
MSGDQPENGAVVSSTAPSPPDEVVKKCKRHGCHREYTEKENQSKACKHHPGWPMFHDVAKRWTCCGAATYDWDDFMKLPGCQTGQHSDVAPVKPTPPVQQITPAPCPTKVQSITEFNRTEDSKKCIEQEDSRAKELKPLVTEDGKYTCCHKGCHIKYDPDDNTTDSCRYKRKRHVVTRSLSAF